MGEQETLLLKDLILSEINLFAVPKSESKYGFSRQVTMKNAPDVKEDKKVEIMASYRESASSLPKMDDLALDLQTCEAQKVSEIPLLDQKEPSWNLIYRRMID